MTEQATLGGLFMDSILSNKNDDSCATVKSANCEK